MNRARAEPCRSAKCAAVAFRATGWLGGDRLVDQPLLRAPGGSRLFFFEGTVIDKCVSIDIAEKYKTTVLGGHRQKTKRKENNKLARLDWGVNTGYRSTILTGRLDWDINTTKL